MNYNQLLAILITWQTAMRESEKRMGELSGLVGDLVESPLGKAIYGLMSAYTEQVCDLIKWPEDMLFDWWTEHRFGEKPMKVVYPGEPERTLATIEDLAKFIHEDWKR